MLVALVWEWHVSTEVCSNISNTFLIIFRSFLFCCCGQTWSAQACVSHATYRRSCSRKWVLMNEFLIWNFSYNFIIIIICFLIAKNKRNLQINQENNILILQKIAPKEKLMKKFQGNGVGWDFLTTVHWIKQVVDEQTILLQSNSQRCGEHRPLQSSVWIFSMIDAGSNLKEANYERKYMNLAKSFQKRFTFGWPL